MPSLVIIKKAERKPPMTGEGKGKGMPGGGRRGKNKAPCPSGGPGYGKGKGRGKGKMRKRSELIGMFRDIVKNAALTNAFALMPENGKKAYSIGMQTGFQKTLPSDEAFAKVAKALRVEPDLLKSAFLVKRAVGSIMPKLLGAGALTYGGLSGLDALKSWGKGGGMWSRRPHMGMIGGMAPREQSDINRMIMRSALRNYQISEMLNQMRAANPMSFRPVI
jgi:hypothetical protein